MKVYILIRTYNSCCSTDHSVMGAYASQELADAYQVRFLAVDGGLYEIEELDVVEEVLL